MDISWDLSALLSGSECWPTVVFCQPAAPNQHWLVFRATGLGVKLDHKQNLWAALLSHKAGSSTDQEPTLNRVFSWTSLLATTVLLAHHTCHHNHSNICHHLSAPLAALLISSTPATHAMSSLSEARLLRTPGHPADALKHHLHHSDWQHCL